MSNSIKRNTTNPQIQTTSRPMEKAQKGDPLNQEAGCVGPTSNDKFQQFLAKLVDGASLQFFDRVVVLAVLLQRQVVDIPVMAQLQDLLDCLPMRFPSCRCSMSSLRRSSRFVRSRGIRSRSHRCSSYSPGQVVACPLCATTSTHGR